MSLERFSRNMRKRARNVPREVNKVKRRTALAVDQTVVVATPVDTGTARSNWIVSLGEASDEVREAYSPIPKGQGDVSETENAQAAIAQGRAAVAQVKTGQDIHITNNVEHIVPLNQGHSAQAPAMFVEQAVDAGVLAVKESKINTG